MQQLDKLDEYEENDMLDDTCMIGNKHDEDLEGMEGYQSDEDILDDNKFKNQMTLSKQNSKKRHLTAQESISDTEFFSQRFDGPGLKNLNKQESIIEEEDIGYPVVDVPKTIAPRVPTTREVCDIHLKKYKLIMLLYTKIHSIAATYWTIVIISSNDNNNNSSSVYN